MTIQFGKVQSSGVQEFRSSVVILFAISLFAFSTCEANAQSPIPNRQSPIIDVEKI
jgi:hypothetical protein